MARNNEKAMLQCMYRGRVMQQWVTRAAASSQASMRNCPAVLAAQLNIPMHDINTAACNPLACRAAPAVTRIWSDLALLGGSAG